MTRTVYQVPLMSVLLFHLVCILQAPTILIGYTCEAHNNPPDFFLDVINGDSTAVKDLGTIYQVVYNVIQYFVILYNVISYYSSFIFITYTIRQYYTILFYIIPYYITSYHFMLHYTISYYLITYETILHHVMLYYGVSCYILPYHTML